MESGTKIKREARKMGKKWLKKVLVPMLSIAMISMASTKILAANVDTVQQKDYTTDYLYEDMQMSIGDTANITFEPVATVTNSGKTTYTGYIGYAVSFSTEDQSTFYEITETNAFGKNVTFEVYDEDYVKVKNSSKTLSQNSRNVFSAKLEENSRYYVLAYTKNVSSVAPGIVSIQVDMVNDDCGDTFNTANYLEVGQSHTGNINGCEDVDIYSFKTSDTDTYYDMQLTNVDCASTMSFTLYDAQGAKIYTSKSTRAQKNGFYLKLEKNAMYYLEVKSTSTTCSEGQYVIDITASEDNEGNSMITAYELFFKGAAYNGMLQDKSDIDFFKYNTKASGKNNIMITNKSQSDKMTYSILKKNGDKIKTGSIAAGKRETITIDVSKNQYYYVSVSGYKGTAYVVEVTSVKHKISYNLNGGTNHINNKSTYDETIPYKLYSPTKKGYMFAGWYSDKNLTKRIKTISATQTKKVNVYAKWKKVTVERAEIKKIKRNGKSAAIKLKKVENAAGYEIRYSLSSKMTHAKKVSMGGTSKKITGLSKKKSYYVQARAYKIDSAKEKVYGKWSDIKSVKK